MSNPIAPWFHNSILDGLQRLRALSLVGTPPAETIALTAQTWIEVLWFGRDWQEEPDRPRLAQAFMALCREVERWPTPSELRGRLPQRAEPVRLPAPALTEDQIRQNHARVAELRARMVRLIEK